MFTSCMTIFLSLSRVYVFLTICLKSLLFCLFLALQYKYEDKFYSLGTFECSTFILSNQVVSIKKLTFYLVYQKSHHQNNQNRTIGPWLIWHHVNQADFMKSSRFHEIRQISWNLVDFMWNLADLIRKFTWFHGKCKSPNVKHLNIYNFKPI